MKDSTNPMIILENREWRGRARILEGEKLLDVLGGLKRKIIDVEIEVPVTRRVYRERRHRDAAQFRLVGIWNDESRAYHLYITNVPPDRLDPEDIARIYAAFQTVAIWILRLLCSGYSEREKWRSIEGFLLHEFRNPNVSRARNFDLSVLK